MRAIEPGRKPKPLTTRLSTRPDLFPYPPRAKLHRSRATGQPSTTSSSKGRDFRRRRTKRLIFCRNTPSINHRTHSNTEKLSPESFHRQNEISSEKHQITHHAFAKTISICRRASNRCRRDLSPNRQSFNKPSVP
ncbi:hypothetical protein Rs2_03512 [Raphanus sativus]|nr:hypothetical protein Rs2_03512 [Raphanus sativus]